MTDTLLSKIKSHADLHDLSQGELGLLAEEIRRLIKTTVSNNGGHLASNLGVVELTLALHYVFDFNRDRILWDVGHQCYVHKILSGRADRFDTLRQAGGISGFPNPDESPTDQFHVGHAGTSVATAVGLALAAQTQKTDEKVVAVVGDASIVNGLSFEGLNNTALVNRQMLLILNDNAMAISTSKGAFANYLTRLRISQPYEALQRRTRVMVQRLPYIGKAIQDALDRIRGGIKSTIVGNQMFEQLGIPYFGPIDGHDLPALIKLLTTFKEIDHPVLLHVRTEKGRGFAPASKDPRTFHSPKPFEAGDETASFADSIGTSFTSAFAHALSDIMHHDERVVALTAAMPDGTGLDLLSQVFPDRVIDVGIAESAAVDIAAGLAKKGLRPVVAIYSTFMQRCFDQIFQEVSLQKLPVVFCVDRAGLVGGDGAVHHGFCDVTLLRSLPNLVLTAPMDEPEMKAALAFALAQDSPCVLRYPRDLVPEPRTLPDGYECRPFELGKAAPLRSGSDAVILAYGAVAYDALLAADSLAPEGVEVAVISARFAKPLPEQLLLELWAQPGAMPIITVEDHALAGGFGSAVLEFAAQQRLDTRRLRCLGLPDRYIRQGTRRDQLSQAGIGKKDIVAAVREVLAKRPAAASDRTVIQADETTVPLPLTIPRRKNASKSVP